MRRVFAACAILFAGSVFFAQESNEPALRYTGFSLGVTALNQYAVGDYGEYVLCNLGGGLVMEYALPLAQSYSWGFSLHGEYAHPLPKSGSIFKSDDEIRVTAGSWCRIPFALGNEWFAFQPELSLGIVRWNSKYDSQNITVSDKSHINFIVALAPALRWMATPAFDVELAPIFTFAPEKEANTMMIGARLGAVFHIQDAIVHKEEIAAIKAARASQGDSQKTVKVKKSAKGDLVQKLNAKKEEAGVQRGIASEKRAESASLTEQINANNAQLAEMKAKFAELTEKEEISAAKKEISALEKATASLEKQAASANSAAEKADSLAQKADAEAEAIVQQIKDRIAVLTENAAAERTNAANKRAESAALTEQINSNNGKIAELNAQLSDLTEKKEISAVNKEISALGKENAALEKKINAANSAAEKEDSQAAADEEESNRLKAAIAGDSLGSIDVTEA